MPKWVTGIGKFERVDRSVPFAVDVHMYIFAGIGIFHVMRKNEMELLKTGSRACGILCDMYVQY